MKKYGEPGWSYEWTDEAKKNLALREEYDRTDNEAYAILKQAGLDAGYGPTRWRMWRAANYVKNRDFVESADLQEYFFLDVLNRKIRHDRDCDCGAKI